MPFTPFIGLSVLVHIGIILWHKIFDVTSNFRALTVQKATRTLRFGISTIIVLIFAVILTSAIGLVRAGVNDKYSNINLVEQFVGYVQNYNFHDSTKVVLAQDDKVILSSTFVSPPKSVTSAASSTLVNNCANSSATTVNYSNSLVNFLISNKRDHSFKSRSYLASTYGIKSYNGTSKQNLFILQKLIDMAKCQT